MLGTLTCTGQFGQASPGREQCGALAVINHVSGRAFSPAHGTGGGGFPHVSEAAPNLSTRRMRRAVLPRVSRRSLAAVSSGSRLDTTPALGTAGGGGIFNLFAGRDQLGGNAARNGTERLPCVVGFHAQQHGGNRGREVVSAFQGRGNVQ